MKKLCITDLLQLEYVREAHVPCTQSLHAHKEPGYRIEAHLMDIQCFECCDPTEMHKSHKRENILIYGTQWINI